MQCDVNLQFFSCGDFVTQVNKGPVEGKLSVLWFIRDVESSTVVDEMPQVS